MNINPSAAASAAGTSRAAARGGDAENQSSEASNRQSAAERPGGKATDSSAVDAGDQTDDRDGNGRQLLDVFEHAGEREDAEQEQHGDRNPASADGSGEHLDFEA